MEQKEIGLPSRSLEGPVIETWPDPPKPNAPYKIGVLFPHFHDPYWVPVDYGIIAQAMNVGVSIWLLDADGYQNLGAQRKHSAGGHLTAMMMATDWPAFDPDLPPDLVKGGCPISGLYDLEPIRHSYLNTEVRLDEADVAAFSPVRWPVRGARWMTITAGDLESGEFHRLQAELVARWRSEGLAVTEVQSPKMHHFNVVMELGRGQSPLFQAVLAGIRGSAA